MRKNETRAPKQHRSSQTLIRAGSTCHVKTFSMRYVAIGTRISSGSLPSRSGCLISRTMSPSSCSIKKWTSWPKTSRFSCIRMVSRKWNNSLGLSYQSTTMTGIAIYWSITCPSQGIINFVCRPRLSVTIRTTQSAQIPPCGKIRQRMSSRS